MALLKIPLKGPFSLVLKVEGVGFGIALQGLLWVSTILVDTFVGFLFGVCW